MRTSRLVAPGILTFVVALFASGVLSRPVIVGLPVTPQLTLILVPVARFLMYATGALAFGGALICGAFGGGGKAIRVASVASINFSIASAAVIVLTLADALATNWWLAFKPQMFRSFVTQIDEGRYLLLQVFLGAVAAWVLNRARVQLEAMFATIALGLAVVLPAFTGHSAAALPHWMASLTMLVHLLAMNAWMGGVLLLVLVPEQKPLLGFGRVASVALAAILLSGIASVIVRVNDWETFFHDRYSLVLLAKIAVTGAVVWFAAKTHSKVEASRSLNASGGDIISAVRQTIAIEGSLMVAVLGLAVVLARMANP
jgi:putative copper export protein